MGHILALLFSSYWEKAKIFFQSSPYKSNNPLKGHLFENISWVFQQQTLSILAFIISVQFSSFAQSCPTLRPHELQHIRPPCQSPTPGVHPNPCPLSRWCHPTILSSVVPFSSCPQSFPASGSFLMSQLFTSDGQSTGVSASTSVLPMNTQDWSPLGWTGWISLQSKGLSRVFSQHHSSKASILQCSAFFIVQLTSIHDYWKTHNLD